MLALINNDTINKHFKPAKNNVTEIILFNDLCTETEMISGSAFLKLSTSSFIRFIRH